MHINKFKLLNFNLLLRTVKSLNRTFSEGQLRMSSGNLLPKVSTASGQEFAAGDVRVNNNPGLTSLHALFVREHNRIADTLYEAGFSNQDEELYQMARKLVRNRAVPDH